MRWQLWAALLSCVAGLAAAPYGDISKLKLAKPEDGRDAKSTPPPKGALVLFGGHSLANWTAMDGKSSAKWELVEGGAMQVKDGNILSRQMLTGDFLLHVEFRVPYLPDKKGQARGNSGVYVQGRYEVQVLDSYGIDKPDRGDCGSIYGVEAPSVNAAKAPTVWQSYDIQFYSPRFADGKRVRPAIMSVFWNGVKVHDNTKIPVDNTTAGRGGDPATPGPVMLQDHGAPVQFRNIWLMPLLTPSSPRGG